MNYLLDTCVISEFVKPTPHSALLEWLAVIPSDTLFLSVITIGEIRKGVIKLADSKKKIQLTLWVNTLIAEYDDRILPIDLAVSERWGILQGKAEKAGTPMPSLDGLIAATASVYNLTIVTRNEQDFLPSHLSLINPWKL